jgi:flagellar motor switch protein FliM
MGNVLSQDEVDSLLGGISNGNVKTETDTPETGVKNWRCTILPLEHSLRRIVWLF